MSRAAGRGIVSRLSLWGPCSRLGLLAGAGVLLLDQAHKWWMLEVYGIAGRGQVRIAPFLDIVLVWNRGISYGLFPQNSASGRAALLTLVLAVVALLLVWMARTRDRLIAFSLGLIIGGAAGNAIDRLRFGAVADFFSLHALGFYWYVFNIADVAIVAGVALLLYDSVVRTGGRGGTRSRGD